MSSIANTPEPPYYAVIFTSLKSLSTHGYNRMAERMLELAAQQPGFLGVESARDDLGITLSYWTDLEAINLWKNNIEHQQAQSLGRGQWYSDYQVRIAKVERAYGMPGDA